MLQEKGAGCIPVNAFSYNIILSSELQSIACENMPKSFLTISERNDTFLATIKMLSISWGLTLYQTT